jgi:hypothetical protein
MSIPNLNVIEIPSFLDSLKYRIPPRHLDSNRSEIELRPEQEIQKHSFAICGYFAHEVQSM